MGQSGKLVARNEFAGRHSAPITLFSAHGPEKQINARVPDNLHGLIVERASLIEQTQGGYLGLIVHRGSAATKGARTDESFSSLFLLILLFRTTSL